MLPGLLFGVLLLAGTAPPITPAPLTHVFTAVMEHKVDDLGQRLHALKRTPGLAIGIVEDGRIVYARGFGLANLQSAQRFDASTQTYVGAVSKEFTAAAVLILRDDGKLKLDDKVTKYVPELTVAKDVTIRQLLNHSSGLPDPSNAPGIDRDRTHSVKLSDLIAAANRLKPQSPPGAQYHENNFDYMIAGLVVERASGVPLSDYLQQHIFIPLIMNETFLAGDTGIASDHAVGYTGSPDHYLRARTWDPAWLYGANDVVSNIYDLAKWDIGMPLLLRVDAMRDMMTPSGVSGPESYGLGWVIDQREGKRYIWASGSIPGYRAVNALLPDDHVAVIVAENVDDSSPGTATPEAIAAGILDIVLPPSTAHMDNSVLIKAREWLNRIATHRIDRTEMTPEFSAYMTDELIAHMNFSSLGKPLAVVPIASTPGTNGDTVYEFLVRYAHAQYHYRLSLTKDGKVDGLVLEP
jgi:D-alanyl-D-alanine carboxypeptidase